MKLAVKPRREGERRAQQFTPLQATLTGNRSSRLRRQTGACNQRRGRSVHGSSMNPRGRPTDDIRTGNLAASPLHERCISNAGLEPRPET